jgi:hypothetical protein
LERIRSGGITLAPTIPGPASAPAFHLSHTFLGLGRRWSGFLCRAVFEGLPAFGSVLYDLVFRVRFFEAGFFIVSSDGLLQTFSLG